MSCGEPFNKGCSDCVVRCCVFVFGPSLLIPLLKGRLDHTK